MRISKLKTSFYSSGVALISVMLLLAFLVTIIAYMLESQYLVIRQASLQSIDESIYLENSYIESWAIVNLTKKATTDSSAKDVYLLDFLDELWAQAELEKNINGLELQATIVDLQSRFNLNNLESGKSSPWYEIFNRLLRSVDVDPTISDAIIDWIDADQNPSGANGAEDLVYLSEFPPRRAANQRFTSVEELLLVKGVSADIYNALLPHITVVDKNDAKINVNTATLPVLQALLTNSGAAESLVGQRQSGFVSIDDVIQLPEFAGTGDTLQAIIDVKSSYFEVKNIAKSKSNGNVYYSGIQRTITDNKLEFKIIYRKRST